MLPVPTRYFVTSGRAMSETSDLNAFDKALVEAEIGEYNLVSVSSVLPIGIKKVEPEELPMGGITHCVLAQQRGSEGETISAGIGYANRLDGDGGYVAEGHGHMSAAALREVLEWKVNEIAGHREVEIDEIQFEIQEMSVPMDHYGCCLAAVVFMD